MGIVKYKGGMAEQFPLIDGAAIRIVVNPCVRFYQRLQGLDWIRLRGWGHLDTANDYYYLQRKDPRADIDELIAKYDLEIIRRYRESNTFLAAPRKR